MCIFVVSVFFGSDLADHPDLHLLTHSFPTRRSSDVRSAEARGDARHQSLFLRGLFGGGGGGHAKPVTMAAVKLTSATPVSTAVARRMRLSASVHAMHAPHATGTMSPPTTSRVCCSPGTSAA